MITHQESTLQLDEQLLLDAAIDHNLVPCEYFSGWEVLGKWQMQALLEIGLRREHYLLDIGCGAMRLGLRAVEYLDDGHYFGCDGFERFLALAHDLTERLGQRKRYTLLCDNQFRFDELSQTFNFAMAQSVFTHLSKAQIERCMRSLRSVMRPGGKFLFTYVLGFDPTLGIMYSSSDLMQKCWIQDDQVLRDIGASAGAELSVLNMAHPCNQRVGLFTFA